MNDRLSLLSVDPVRWLPWVIPGSLMVVASLLVDTRLSITFLTPVGCAILGWLAVTLGAAIAWRGHADHTRHLIGETGLLYFLFTVLTLTGAVGSYPVAALTRGDVDSTLAHMDRLLGFDWNALYAFVAAHPVLQVMGGIAYQSIYLSPAIILGYAGMSGQIGRGRTFLATFWLAAVIAMVLFAFMPAFGPLSTQWQGPIPYWPASGTWEAELIPALRHHALHTVDLGSLKGLVSAPSFHTATAVLYICAAWPVRALRWPILALNTAMLLSTPIEGTHYLTDMLLGALVAAVAQTAVAALTSSATAARSARARLAAS